MDLEQEQYKSKSGKHVLEAKGPMAAEHMKNVLHQMDKTGDTKFMWDSKNPDEVAAARNQFNELKKKKYIAFKVSKGGDKGEQIDEFDPEAEKIIMAPPMKGG